MIGNHERVIQAATSGFRGAIQAAMGVDPAEPAAGSHPYWRHRGVAEVHAHRYEMYRERWIRTGDSEALALMTQHVVSDEAPKAAEAEPWCWWSPWRGWRPW